jgi:hypothetical protein
MSGIRDGAIQNNVPKAVEDAILESNHPIEMRRAMIEAMARNNMPVPVSRDEDLNMRGAATPAVQTLSEARPAQEPTCFRVVYPHGNNRFEIYGTSEAQLDAQERQIRAMFGGQR